MQEELAVAFGARRSATACRRRAINPSSLAAAATSSITRAWTAGVADEAALADFVPAGFELRLHERDDVARRDASSGDQRGRMWRSEMNETSTVTRSKLRASRAAARA